MLSLKLYPSDNGEEIGDVSRGMLYLYLSALSLEPCRGSISEDQDQKERNQLEVIPQDLPVPCWTSTAF